MMVAVVVLAVWSTATATLAGAVAGGFLLDLASGTDFGLHMAVYVVVGLSVVAGRQLGLAAGSPVTAGLALIVGTLVYDAAVLAAWGGHLPLAALGLIGRELICNLVLLVLVLLVGVWLAGWRRPAGGGSGPGLRLER
jgi:hypothetical protein